MKKNSNKYLKERVKDIEVEKKSISKLMSEMADTGFQGRKIGEAVNIWERMIKDKNVTIFMGLAGSMSTTGQWRLIKWLMENRFIDVLVSTGANISEDIQDSLHGYYKGHWIVDDADLLKNNIFRYYDVFTDGLKYRRMTELIRDFINSLKDGYPYSSREFCQEFGKFQLRKNIDSLLSTAYRKNIPVYSPAIMDSEYGIAAVISRRWDKRNIVVDQMKDFEELAKIGEKSKKTGVIYIGGGVPKDTIQLITAIVSILKGEKLEFPHSYAIQITTDSPQWGGLCLSKFSNIIVANEKIKKAKDIKVGDKLLTTDNKGNITTTEVKKVLKRKINNGETICIIKIEDNRVKCGGVGVTKGKISGHKVHLVVTEDHLVFTQRGWVKAKELTLEDRVLKITQYDKISFDRENKIPSHLIDYLFRSGKDNPSAGKTGAQNPFFGKTHSKATREYLSSLKTGKTWEELFGEEKAKELRKKYKETMGGERNPSWAGGTSWEPYNKEFWEVRKKVLQKDSYKCRICGITEKESLQKYKQYLCVHHIDYNKKNSNFDNLVTLCISCHGKTIFPQYRESWKEKLITAVDKDCPEFLPIKEIVVYKNKRQIVGCLHGNEVYDFICEPYHRFFADWILIHNSGCTFEEAVSWGKITKKDNDKAVCYCDATIALPIILNALNEKIQKDGAGKFKRKAPDFSWLLKK